MEQRPLSGVPGAEHGAERRDPAATALLQHERGEWPSRLERESWGVRSKLATVGLGRSEGSGSGGEEQADQPCDSLL